MYKIGIIQGRVIPERLDRLQVFPVSNWQKELVKIKEIGFDYVELLFDKDLVFEKLLSNSENLNILGIKNGKSNSIMDVHSICVDYFSLISLMSVKTEQLFYDKLIKLFKLINNSNIRVMVIPFFGKNLIESINDFKFVLDWMEKKKLDEIAFENNLVIALELNLPASQTRDAMSDYQFSNVGICYDLGNARAKGYCPEEEILLLKEFFVHVHIKDRKFNGPNVMLGEGNVNFKACFKSIKQIGYDGLMTLETGYYNSPAIEALENLQFVKKMLECV